MKIHALILWKLKLEDLIIDVEGKVVPKPIGSVSVRVTITPSVKKKILF